MRIISNKVTPHCVYVATSSTNSRAQLLSSYVLDIDLYLFFTVRMSAISLAEIQMAYASLGNRKT